MPTGLTQKPTADAAGGSRTCVLTLHVIIVATRFPAGTIARRVQEIRATCGRDRASPRRSRFSEPHAAPRTAAAPSPASPALPRRASSRERGCVSENLSHVPEPFTLIRRSSWGKVWPCFLLFYHFPRHCFPTIVLEQSQNLNKYDFGRPCAHRWSRAALPAPRALRS
jgi:hypothetical protein